jgi:hypothetical protein
LWKCQTLDTQPISENSKNADSFNVSDDDAASVDAADPHSDPEVDGDYATLLDLTLVS